MVWNRRHRWRGRRPETVAAVVGAGAFLAGYVLVYTVAVYGVREPLRLPSREGLSVGDPIAAGWMFYNAHFVDVLVSAGDFGLATSPVNYIAAAGHSPLLYAVPPVALVAAGGTAVSAIGISERRDAVVAGASTAIGYLLCALIGAFSLDFVWLGPAYTFRASPDQVPAILVAGLLYPVVFGSLGGRIGAVAGPHDWPWLRGLSG